MIVSGWTARRGRSYEMDKNMPGIARVELIDTTGELDPASGAYDFTPGTPGAVALHNPVDDEDYPVLVGNIARYTYNPYPTYQYATATLEIVDGLHRLAKTEMYAGTGEILEWGQAAFVSRAQDGDVWFDVDETGSAVANRINMVLDQAQWPSGLREIYSGNVKLHDVVYAYRTPALTAILDAADAEFPGIASNFYVQKDGRATFHGRLARFKPNDVQYHITTWDAGDLAVVEGDPSVALIFEPFSYGYDVEKIINSAIVTPKGIADADINDQRVEDGDSIEEHGSWSVSFHDLLTRGDHFDGANANDATKKMAQFFVSNYKDPELHLPQITFKRLPPGDPKAEAVWDLMCRVDISDIINLQTERISGEFYVEGLSYTTKVGNETFDDVTLTLDLSPKAYFNTNPFE